MSLFTITSEDLPIRANIKAAGATCLLAANSSSVIDSIAQLHPFAQRASKRSFGLNVLIDPSITRDRLATPHFRGRGHLVFALFSAQEMFAFDLQRKVGFGAVSRETACNPEFWNRTLLPIALGVLGSVIGVIPLHAACLDRNGRALMIAGHSGAGKSTLAVALSRYGFSLVSDDWTYLTKDANGLTAHGLRAPVKLLPDAVSYFPELAAFLPVKSLNGEMAYEVNPHDVFSARVRSESAPSRILFLDRLEKPGCTFIPCQRSKARRFFEDNSERLPDEFGSFAAERSRIIDEFAKLDCWLVTTGDSPDQTAVAVSRFCEN